MKGKTDIQGAVNGQASYVGLSCNAIGPVHATASRLLLAAPLLVAWATSAAAQEPSGKSWNDLATAQTEANRQAGARQVPPRALPVPKEGVSLQEQAVIAGAYVPYWNADPRNAAEWKDFVDKAAAPVPAALPAMREGSGSPLSRSRSPA